MQPEFLEVGDDLSVVENADNHAFELVFELSRHNGHNGHAKAQLVAVHDPLNEPVLRHFAFEPVNVLCAVFDDSQDSFGDRILLTMPYLQVTVKTEQEIRLVPFCSNNVDVADVPSHCLDKAALEQIHESALVNLCIQYVFVDLGIFFTPGPIINIQLFILQQFQKLILLWGNLFHQVLKFLQPHIANFIFLHVKTAGNDRKVTVCRVGCNDNQLVRLAFIVLKREHLCQ